MKRRFVVLCVCAVLFSVGAVGLGQLFTSDTVFVMAEDIAGDDLGGGGGGVSDDDKGVADFFRNHRAMTDDQLRYANQTLSPITNIIGYFIGGVVALTGVLLFAITALDLLYIAFPPIRNLLYKSGTDGTGAYTAGRGGMGGMGMGGYGMGGMGMGGAAGGASGGTNKPTQWISDEAVQCAAMLGGSAMTEGMGMQGGMMGQAGGQQQEMTKKSVIGVYFKKRIGFMILFGLCIVILLSSALIGTGVNLAEWGLTMINTLNSYIPR